MALPSTRQGAAERNCQTRPDPLRSGCTLCSNDSLPQTMRSEALGYDPKLQVDLVPRLLDPFLLKVDLGESQVDAWQTGVSLSGPLVSPNGIGSPPLGA